MFYEIFLSPQVKRWAIVIYKHSISSRFAQPSPAQPSPAPTPKWKPRNESNQAPKSAHHPPHPATAPRTPPQEPKQTDPISISQPSHPRHARNPKIQPKLGKQARQQASQISQPSHTTPQQSISHQLQKFLKPTEITRGWYLYFHFFFFFFFFCLFCLFFFVLTLTFSIYLPLSRNAPCEQKTSQHCCIIGLP